MCLGTDFNGFSNHLTLTIGKQTERKTDTTNCLTFLHGFVCGKHCIRSENRTGHIQVWIMMRNGENCFSYELRFTSYLSHIEVAKPSKSPLYVISLTD